MIPAAERLAASRERLRQALAPDGPGADGRAGGGSGDSVIGSLARAWGLPQLTLAADLADAAIGPLAQRRPLTLVLAAALAGAALVRLRPWRGLLRQAVLAGAVPLWTQLFGQLSKKA